MRSTSQKRRPFDNSNNGWTVANYILLFTVFVWFLAVVKVFLLEYHGATPFTAPIIASTKQLKINALGDSSNKNEMSYLVDNYNSNSRQLKVILSAADASKAFPGSNEWLYIRSTPGYVIQNEFQHGSPVTDISNRAKGGMVVVPNIKKVKSAKELMWPPVLSDLTIPEEDGFDNMPYSGLKVPRFWEPSGDVLKSGSKVNGEETIFLMIASYRDFQCRETITSAFAKADHPERLFIGAVDQIAPGDKDLGCLDIAVPCDQNPNQPICKYRDQISIFKMDASTATGPVTARHIGDRMYRGQYFVMQMDAHCLFVRHWDTQIINQWRLTGNEMAVLSSYLTDVQGSIDGNGDSTRNTRPIMCNSDFEGMMPARYLRHGAQPEEEPVLKEMPMMQPFWAAGFSFSRGHFKVQVPYDAYQPMVFQGEEIAIGIRGFTFGYDFYAPRDSVVFHEYAVKSNRRKTVHMFWENTKHAGEGERSLRRATSVIGMALDIDPATYDHTDEHKYGLGKVRKLDLFYKIFLIDREHRKATQLCPFVRSGKMHREFQKYLRPDGLGVDYSYLENFDTAAAMPKHYN